MMEQKSEINEIVEAVARHKTPEAWLSDVLHSLPCEPATSLPSEWASNNRFMTATASPFPGRWEWRRSPWFKEVLDHLSPHSPTQRVAVMKATQIAFTAAVLENAIGFTISAQPSPTLYVTGNEDLVAATRRTRLDPMIDSSGLRKFIKADSSSNRKGIKRTGDTKGMLEFTDGFLRLCGPAVESSFQGISYKVLLMDELDLYPPKLGRSGETVKVIEARADSFGHRKKILYGSRPTVSFGIAEQTKNDEDGVKRDVTQVGSRILDLYNTGDKRAYNVPCPHCGELQVLNFFANTTDEGKRYGLVFDSDECRDGDFSSVEYRCFGCGDAIQEYHKSNMVQPEAGAVWIPTAKAKEPDFVSYQISSMYSLTVTWAEMVMEFLGSKGDVTKLQLFYNRFLGIPFEDRSGGLDVSKLSNNTGKYHANTIPKGALFLTASCDVQRGKSARLEVEIRAWGRDYRSWGVDYRVLKGNTEDKNDPVWGRLGDILDETWGPNNMQVERLLVDSGDGVMTSTVYDACRKFGQGDASLMMPLKGLALTSRSRINQCTVELQNERFPLIEVYVDLYKNRLSNYLRQDWRDGEKSPVGWAEFPTGAGYGRTYFRQLGNEEKLISRNGSQMIVRWVSRGRNEAWDLLVYGLACCDFVLDDYSQNVLGYDKSNPEAVWEYFEGRSTPQ